MNKRKTKKILANMIKSNIPPLEDSVFCLSRGFDYGGKKYKGVELHYFNIIPKGVIYLLSKEQYNNLYN